MLIVRATKKLRDLTRGVVPLDAGERSTTQLGGWFATAMFWRPQVAMFVNERTFVPVFVPLAPTATLFDRLPAAIASVLRRHGVPDDIVARELDAMSEVRLAPTNDPRMIGVMNGFCAYSAQSFHGGVTDLEELSMRTSQLMISPLELRGGAPDRELVAFFGLDDEDRLPSNVIKFPGSYRPDVRVYQLKVTIQGIKPPVWRRIHIDGASTLDEVHEVIQAAFGWWNHHLHGFEVDGQRFGVPDHDDDRGLPMVDETVVRLDSLVAVEGTTIDYTYDFGDGWNHKIVVEKILPAFGVTVPACVGGRRACPPEDCGGPWGYQDLLRILADPTDPEHTMRAEWIGGHFDPEAFTTADFETNLRDGREAQFDV